MPNAACKSAQGSIKTSEGQHDQKAAPQQRDVARVVQPVRCVRSRIHLRLRLDQVIAWRANASGTSGQKNKITVTAAVRLRARTIGNGASPCVTLPAPSAWATRTLGTRWAESSRVEQRAQHDHPNRKPMLLRHRAGQHVPLGHEAHRRWQADHRQRRDREGSHGPWHAPADAVELADLGLVRCGVDRAGRKEQRDLADSVSGDMQDRADRAKTVPAAPQPSPRRTTG